MGNTSLEKLTTADDLLVTAGALVGVAGIGVFVAGALVEVGLAGAIAGNVGLGAEVTVAGADVGASVGWVIDSGVRVGPRAIDFGCVATGVGTCTPTALK
jgi:hypothetical protein